MSKRVFHLACHCQANILRITFPESVKPFEKNDVCDCSFCLKRRIIWAFAPEGSGKVLKGMDKLQTYQFGNKTLYHQVGTGSSWSKDTESGSLAESADHTYSARLGHPTSILARSSI